MRGMRYYYGIRTSIHIYIYTAPARIFIPLTVSRSLRSLANNYRSSSNLYTPDSVSLVLFARQLCSLHLILQFFTLQLEFLFIILCSLSIQQGVEHLHHYNFQITLEQFYLRRVYPELRNDLLSNTQAPFQVHLSVQTTPL